MDGYRYWVERHKLLIGLAREKDLLDGVPVAERMKRTIELEQEFRVRLDALYSQARENFETPPSSTHS